MGIIYDYCEGCEEICCSPRCFNCPYFDDSYLMDEPDDDEEYDEDFEEYEKRMLEEEDNEE